jgi:hypothetical protein
MQAFQRIDDERQRLVVDLDEVDRILRELLGLRGDGEIPSTPLSFSAAEASMFFTLACGIGLVSSRQNTMPSAR